MVKEYKAEQATDFNITENKIAFENALENVKKEFGVERPIVIGGKYIQTNDKNLL